MQDSLAIVAIFLAGIVSGFLFDLSWLTYYDPSLPALWLLMALVGFSIGTNTSFKKLFSSLSRTLLLLPAATTLGTFAGALFASIFLNWPLNECLAISSGFAYYSLSSVFITRFLGPDPGAAALISNILRELLTLLTAPFIIRALGAPAAISSGGATTMDTTLPVIINNAGANWAAPAIYHAMLLDISVPFWVSLFCKM